MKMNRKITKLGMGVVFATGLRSVVAQSLSDSVVDAVRANMNSSSTASWEMGTATEAILEHDISSLSVFANSPAYAPANALTANSIDSVLYFTKSALKQRNGTTTIIKDGASGDPASLGVACILGNLTGADTGVSGLSYTEAAVEEVEWLLTSVPRAPNGAISHRNDEVALWSDFIYMVPPFLAYLGVVTKNESLVQEAYNQISYYRDDLRDSDTSLWRHVVLGKTFNDTGFWSTGNAWAAAGIVRVLATIQNSQFSSNFKSQKSDLANWVTEIHAGYYSRVDSTTFMGHNYINDTTTFLDASGSTLLASTVFRLAVLEKKYTHVPIAQKYYASLVSGNVTNGAKIDSNGWLTPVVDPLNFTALGQKSPESQSFVMLLDAAHRDWVNAGSKGAKGAAIRLGSSRLMAMGSALFAVGVVALML